MRIVLPFSFIAITFAYVLNACTKEDNTPPSMSKEAFLTQGTWKQTGYAIDKNFDEQFESSEWVTVSNYDLYLQFKHGGGGSCHKTYTGYDNTCPIEWGYSNNNSFIFIHSYELNDNYGFESATYTTLVLKNNSTYPHSWMIFGQYP